MNKKIKFFAIALLLAGHCAAQAQDSVSDNEISLTDGKGNKEIIEFPEAI